MNLAESILQIHPNLNDDDFIVQDHWNWPEITWYNQEITEPTTEELETAWILCEAEETKQSDIESFRSSDECVTKLKAKKAELEEVYFNDNCSAENKVLILDVTTALQVEIDTEEANRAALMAQWVIDYWAGISADYASQIINEIRWNI